MGLSLVTWATTMLGVVSPLLTIGQSVLQATRVVRSGAEGVSASTWMLFLVVTELWAVYGFLARIPAEIATNLPNGALCLLVLVLVARRRGTTHASMLGTAALSMLVAGLTVGCVVGRAEGIESAVAVAGTLGLYVPQLRKSLRESELAGVSLASWVLACLAAISWGIYGLAIHKAPVYLPSVLLLPTSLIIVVRASSFHYRATRRQATCGAGTERG